MRIFLLTSIYFLVGSAFAAEPLILTETSLGPISGKTRVTTANLKKYFVGYKIQRETFFIDGDASGESFKLSLGDDPIIEINANTTDKSYIYSVIIHDPKIKTPGGIHIGSKLDDLIALKVLNTCTRGPEETQHEVKCDAKNGSNIGYSFLISAEEEALTEPGAVIGVAIQPKRRIVTGITWHPPRKLK